MAFFYSKTSSKILPKYTIALFFAKENPGDFPEAEKALENKSIICILLSNHRHFPEEPYAFS